MGHIRRHTNPERHNARSDAEKKDKDVSEKQWLDDLIEWTERSLRQIHHCPNNRLELHVLRFVTAAINIVFDSLSVRTFATILAPILF